MDSAYFGHAHRIKHMPSSPTLSTFAPSNILPEHDPFLVMDELILDEAIIDKFPQVDSASDISIHKQADVAKEEERQEDSPQRVCNTNWKRFSGDETTAFDLKPPPPTESDPLCEILTTNLYSIAHLNIILKNPTYFQRFRAYLNRHRPHSVPTLVRYLESQKALTAIRYANSLADHMSIHSRHTSRNSGRSEAASIDTRFENFSRRALEELVTDALPAYITYRMVTLVTECLVKEITGCNTPFMRDLVKGLAEVYCLTDPKQPDNPIVFASEGMFTVLPGNFRVAESDCRVLQDHPIRARIRHWEELSVSAGAKDTEGCCQTDIQCDSQWPRDQ